MGWRVAIFALLALLGQHACGESAAASNGIGGQFLVRLSVATTGNPAGPGRQEISLVARTLSFPIERSGCSSFGVEIRLSDLAILSNSSGSGGSTGGFHRTELPPQVQRRYSNPFFLVTDCEGWPSEIVCDPYDEASVVSLKRSIATSLVASLPNVDPEAMANASATGVLDARMKAAGLLMDSYGEAGGARPLTWESMEIDPQGPVRPLYTAVATGIEDGRARSLVVKRDVIDERYYAVPGKEKGRGLHGLSGALGSTQLRADSTTRLLHTTSTTFDVGATAAELDLALHPAAGVTGDATSLRPVHSVSRLLHTKTWAALTIGAPESVEELQTGEDAPEDMPSMGVTVQVDMSRMRQPAAVHFSCSKRLLRTDGSSPRWCSSVDRLGDDDNSDVIMTELSTGSSTIMGADPQSFHGPQLLHRALQHSAGSTPSSSSLGDAVGNVLASQGRRLVRIAGNSAGAEVELLIEPVGTDAAHLAAAARETRLRRASAAARTDPFTGGYARSLSGESLYGDARTALSDVDLLERVSRVLTCFPAGFHDDDQPRPGVLETDVIPCVADLHNLTSTQPNSLIAIHALLLTRPCDASSFDWVSAADKAAFFMGGSRLLPDPCADDVNGYRLTQLSDKMVDVLIGGIASSSLHAVAHPILSHMLTAPHFYRYVTVLERALQSLLYVHHPTGASSFSHQYVLPLHKIVIICTPFITSLITIYITQLFFRYVACSPPPTDVE